MTKQIEPGTSGWKKSNFDKDVASSAPEMQDAWAKHSESVIAAANKYGISPMMALARVASVPGDMSSGDVAFTLQRFSQDLSHYDGDVRGAVSAGINGRDATDAWLGDTGALPQDRSTLDAQERVLSLHDSSQSGTLMSTAPATKQGSAVMEDKTGKNSDTQSSVTILDDATPSELDAFLRDGEAASVSELMANSGLETHKGVTAFLGEPNQYAEASYEDYMDYASTLSSDGPNSFLDDMKNAFVGGVATNITDTALITGVIAERLGFEEAGESLQDWSMGASAAISRRFAVEHPSFWTALSGGLGSMTPSLITGGIGGRLITTGVGRVLTQRMAAQMAKTGLTAKVGGALAGRAKQIGTAAGMAIPEAFAQGGNTYASAIQQGASEDEAWSASRNDILINIGVLGASDMVFTMGLGSSGRRILLNTLARGGSEALQEVLQGVSQRWQLRDYSETGFHLYDQDMLTEAGVGFVLGAVVGTGIAYAQEGSPTTQKKRKIAEKVFAEDTDAGLKVGTSARIKKDIEDKLLTGDLVRSGPEETNMLMQFQILVDALDQGSKKVSDTGVSVEVDALYKDVAEKITNKKLFASLSPEQQRAHLLLMNALESHIIIETYAQSMNKSHTIKQQQAAVQRMIEKLRNGETLTPRQTLAIAGALRNLAAKDALSQETIDAISAVSPQWQGMSALANGKGLPRYSGQVVPRYAEGESPGTAEAVGYDLVYTTLGGTVQHVAQFDTEAEAKAKYRELSENILTPEDFGMESATAMRTKLEEKERRDKGESPQDAIDRITAQIDKQTKKRTKIQDALSSSPAEHPMTLDEHSKAVQEVTRLTEEINSLQEPLAVAQRTVENTSKPEEGLQDEPTEPGQDTMDGSTQPTQEEREQDIPEQEEPPPAEEPDDGQDSLAELNKEEQAVSSEIYGVMQDLKDADWGSPEHAAASKRYDELVRQQYDIERRRGELNRPGKKRAKQAAPPVEEPEVGPDPRNEPAQPIIELEEETFADTLGEVDEAPVEDAPKVDENGQGSLFGLPGEKRIKQADLPAATLESINRLKGVTEALGYTVEMDAQIDPSEEGAPSPWGSVSRNPDGGGTVSLSPENIKAELEGKGEEATEEYLNEIIQAVLAHELGHALSTEFGGKRNEHRELVQALLADLEVSDAELAGEVRERYERGYKEGKVTSEVMADFVADVLLTEDGLKRLEAYIAMNQDKAGSALTMVQLAKKWLRKLWRQVGGDESQFIKAQLRRLEELEKRLLNEVRAQSPSNVRTPEQQMERLAGLSTEKPGLTTAEPSQAMNDGVASPQGPVFDRYETFERKMNTQQGHKSLAERNLKKIRGGGSGAVKLFKKSVSPSSAQEKRDTNERNLADANAEIALFEQLNPEFSRRYNEQKSTVEIGLDQYRRNPAKTKQRGVEKLLPNDGKPRSGGKGLDALEAAGRSFPQSFVEDSKRRISQLSSALSFLNASRDPDKKEFLDSLPGDEGTTGAGIDEGVNALHELASGERMSSDEKGLALQLASVLGEDSLYDAIAEGTANQGLDEALFLDETGPGAEIDYTSESRANELLSEDIKYGPHGKRIARWTQHIKDAVNSKTGNIGRIDAEDILRRSGVDPAELSRLSGRSSYTGVGGQQYSIEDLAMLLVAAKKTGDGNIDLGMQLINEQDSVVLQNEGDSTRRGAAYDANIAEKEEAARLQQIEDDLAVFGMEKQHETYEFLGLPFGKSAKEAHQDPDYPATQTVKNRQFEGARKKHQSFRDKLHEGSLGFYSNFVDQGHQAKYIVELMTDPSTEDLLLQGRSFYHNMKGLMTGWGGAADFIVKNGWHTYEEGNKTEVKHGLQEKRGVHSGGLGNILDANGIGMDEESWGDINAYLEARRVTTIHNETPEKIHPLYDMAIQVQTLAEMESKYDGKDGRPDFKKTGTEIDLFARGMIEFLVEMGNITSKSADAMLATGFYIPLHAAALEHIGGAGTNQAAVKGVDRMGQIEETQVSPPLDELAAQVAQVVHAGYSNHVKVKLKELLGDQLNPLLGEVLDLQTGEAAHTRGQVIGSYSKTSDTVSKLLTAIDDLAKVYDLGEIMVSKMKAVVENDAEADLNVQIWMSKIDLGTDMISYFEDGRFGVMRVHQDIADRFQQEGVDASKKVIEVAARSTRLLRTGATLDPGFWARNFLRDVPAAIMGSIGMVNNIGELGAFMGQIVGTPAGYIEAIKTHGLAGVLGGGTIGDVFRGDIPVGFAMHGGSMATMSSRDAEADLNERRQTVAGLRSKGLVRSTKEVLRHPLQFLEQMSSNMETITRVAVYQQRLKQHSGKDVPWHIMSQMASLDSRDATIDFSRMGEYGRVINKLSPFWNAQVQGLDKMARSFKEDPMGTTVRGTLMLTLPSMALYAMNAEEPWYQRLPAWQKNMFWLFSVNGGDTIYRIPKPFDWGMLFASLPERLADEMLLNDPKAFRDWSSMMAQMMITIDPVKLLQGDMKSLAATLPMPPIAGSFAALAAGHDPFTGSRITPPGLENTQKGMQYTHNTSWLARAAVEFIEDVGGKPLVSPIEIDYMIRANFGGLGSGTMAGASSVARKLGIGSPPEGRFETRDFVDRAMFLSAFNVDEHSANTSHSTRFHELLRSAASAERTVNRAKNTGDRRDMGRYEHLQPLAYVSRAMRATAEQAKVLTASIKVLEHDTTIDPALKKRKRQEFIRKRDLLYQKAVESFTKYMKKAEKKGKQMKGRN